MNNKFRTQVLSGLLVLSMVVGGCAGTYAQDQTVDTTSSATVKQNKDENKAQKPPKKDDQEEKEKKEDKEKKNDKDTGGSKYSIEQAMSDRAQLTTIAFSGLAFITGSAGADTFMPPGKVADFFGFQYMRDVDEAGYGHNTQFLTRVANNILHILDDEQKAKLITLAKEQADLYTEFAYNRFPLMDAFRDALEGNYPEGTNALDVENVGEYTAKLYEIDADLSYNRAIVMGEIINSFSDDQIAYLADMDFNNFNTWPDVDEDEDLKKSMSHTEFVAVMTYASEMFSWYKGSVEADIYFCPERHGTYFGGFFMKDYPAMNNPDYFISTTITGNKGDIFLEILNDDQRALIEGIIEEQKDEMNQIAQIRTLVSEELRKAQTGGTVNKEIVYELIEQYGKLDGEISALYAQRFAQVNETLTDAQRAELVELRDLDVVPEGAYMFSAPIDMPEIPDNAFMFGKGEVSENAGKYEAPEVFKEAAKQVENKDQNREKPEGEEDGNRPPKPEGEEKGNRPPKPEGEEKGNRPPRPEDKKDESAD